MVWNRLKLSQSTGGYNVGLTRYLPSHAMMHCMTIVTSVRRVLHCKTNRCTNKPELLIRTVIIRTDCQEIQPSSNTYILIYFLSCFYNDTCSCLATAYQQLWYNIQCNNMLHELPICALMPIPTAAVSGRHSHSLSQWFDITQLSTVGNYVFLMAGSHLWNSPPADVTSAPLLTVFRNRLKPTSFLDHFLPNCFRFLVLYTVHSSGLAVLCLSHSK